MRLDPAALPETLANHVLDRETWARERLSAHAGRMFVITVGPLATALAIDASGMVATAPLSGAVPDLTLRLSPLDLPAFLAAPERWNRFVASEGDPVLAATLKDLAQTLPWFVEQAFAKTLGPIIGQRVADAGRALLAFPEYAAEHIGDSVVSYARDEAGLVARGDEARTFVDQVAVLAARVDALAERVAAAEARVKRSRKR